MSNLKKRHSACKVNVVYNSLARFGELWVLVYLRVVRQQFRALVEKPDACLVPCGQALGAAWRLTGLP